MKLFLIAAASIAFFSCSAPVKPIHNSKPFGMTAFPIKFAVVVPQKFVSPGLQVKLTRVSWTESNGQYSTEDLSTEVLSEEILPGSSEYINYVEPIAHNGDKAFFATTPALFEKGDEFRICLVDAAGTLIALPNRTEFSGCFHVFGDKAMELMRKYNGGTSSSDYSVEKLKNLSNPAINLGWE